MIGFHEITPTFYFRKDQDSLQQLVRVFLRNEGSSTDAVLRISMQGRAVWWKSFEVPPGISLHDVLIPEITQACKAEFSLINRGISCDSREVQLEVQRKWTVHVVQTSHHDPGYTDLPSLVLRQHDGFLNEAIDLAEATSSYPEDAQFRMVIEQAWSIDHLLKHMPEDRKNKIVSLMCAGRFELTALFGNMTSEICGHETLMRALYPAFGIKRKYGVPIVSAEHNDITGISWGLSRVLTDAGVKIFCPGIPLYYNWGTAGMPSFWDQERIFGREGPGAFWWEAPSGKRLLFWCNNSGCGGSTWRTLPDLEDALKRISDQGYPWDVLRWPVGGGNRDNSPYIAGYADTIRNWNEQWVFPHLVCSTNARFYGDFICQDLSNLPVWRGELPGQDYPSGATSTAAPLAANRTAHQILVSAEKLSVPAESHAARRYPAEILSEACEEILWHDEHAWGYHFPCGPAMRASRHEKALHAYRAEALAQGVLDKAMASLADRMQLGEGFHLVVFNSTSWPRTAPVQAPLREMDNSGSEMRAVSAEKDPRGVGFLKGYVLGDRFHTILPSSFLDGGFALQDTVTGEDVPYRIREIGSPMDPVPYSEERLGIGSGTKRYGFFEVPLGLKRDVCFVAQDVPEMGWKAYRLVSSENSTCLSALADDLANAPFEELASETIHNQGGCIGNDHYQVTVDARGVLSSILDRQANRELIDGSQTHGLFSLLVRQGNSPEIVGEECLGISVDNGPVFSEIIIRSRAFGHPEIEKKITLYEGIKQIHFAIKVLKDSTPLLNAHIAFPFAAEKPEFRYEGCLAVMTPVKDYLPGSFSDTIAVQNWVKMKDGDFNILWSSLDAPIAGFGRLWPGYVSPAHRAVMDECILHLPQKETDFDTGHIYSQVFNNNFGTNFSVSQHGETLFRYVLSTESGEVSDADAARFGWQAITPLNQILTDRAWPVVGGGIPNGSITDIGLVLSGSFVKTDNDKIAILTCKKAEDGNGTILRLWNLTSATERAKVIFPLTGTIEAMRTNLCEENTGDKVSCFGNTMDVEIGAEDIITIRVSGM